jgi:hypothetical protein
MTTEDRTNDTLSGDILNLRADPRFSCLFRCQEVSLALWIIEFDHAENSGVRLLYSWVVASLTRDLGWRFLKGEEFPTVVPGSHFGFGRLVLNQAPDKVMQVLVGLLHGDDLAAACTKAGIAPPETAAALRLAKNPMAISSGFVFGPVRFLSGDSTHLSRHSRRMHSPSHSQPSFCASLVRLGKTDLFLAETRVPFPAADELARSALRYLDAETGLAFAGSDAVRLGNIEWFSLPTTDAYENEYVTVNVRTHTEGRFIRGTHVEVNVQPGGLAQGARILVRCRQFLTNDVTSDECREGLVGGATISFPVPQDISRWLVTIWTIDQSGVSHIWFEDEAVLIQEIVLHFGLMGLSGRLDSDWTTALGKKRRPLAERIDEIRRLSQVSYETSSVGGSRDPWDLAEREVDRLAARLFPEKSTARFFQRGWADEGRVSFIEWFVHLSAEPGTTEIVIVDPFFDVDGVVDVLARARATQTRYIVLTNTQVPSKDDSPMVASDESASEPLRGVRIRKACERLRPVLSRINFEIRDLRRRRESRDQLFHDRYLLAFGNEHGEREVLKGFHFSNSIQGATRHSPLLITPIPNDILGEVASYVGSLVEADSDVVGQAEVVTIASSEMLRATISPTVQAATNPGELFADLLQEPTLRDVDLAVLKAQLTAQGIMVEGDSYRFLPELQPKFSEFMQRLVRMNDIDFVRMWALLGDWMAHTANGESQIRSIFAECGDSLATRLVKMLKNSPTTEPPLGFRGRPLSDGISGQGHLFRRDFASVLTEAGYLVDHFRNRFYGSSVWGVRYGVSALLHIAPERLIVLAGEAWNAIPNPDRENDAATSTSGVLNLLGVILDRVIEELSSGHLLPMLLHSGLPVFRAIGAQYAISRVGKLDLDSAIKWLNHLEPTEALEAATEWVDDLRVQANRNEMKEPAEIREKRLRVFGEIRRLWPATMESQALRRVARRLGGPGEGGWALSTTNDLFAELVAAGQLSWESVAGLWWGILSERLEQYVSRGNRPPGSHYSFYDHNDTPLTEAAALALARSASTMRLRVREDADRIRTKALRIVNTPFPRSRDWKRWSDAIEVLRWLRAAAGCVLLHDPGSLDGKERDSWREMRQKIATVLSNFRTEEHEGAEAFNVAVDRAIQSQQS